MEIPSQKQLASVPGRGAARWKWMAAATAATAVAAPLTHATTAEISLINNHLDSISGNSLTFRISSSGLPFATVGTLSYRHGAGAGVATLSLLNRSGHVAGTAQALFQNGSFVAKAGGASHRGTVAQEAFALVPITLSDPNVNGGAGDTGALLEVEAFNQSATDQTISLLNVFYTEGSSATPSLTINSTTGEIIGSYTEVGYSDDSVFTGTVPEPSPLALLALGAAGILARRRR